MYLLYITNYNKCICAPRLLYATGTIPTNHPCLATFYGFARFGGWHHFFKLAFPPLTLTSLLKMQKTTLPLEQHFYGISRLKLL
jgi:hypothetical protein